MKKLKEKDLEIQNLKTSIESLKKTHKDAISDLNLESAQTRQNLEF